MALTMAPPSLHGSGPSWDEHVVPALRARLTDESRVLAKRLSAASLASSHNDEHHWDIYDSYADPDPDYPKPTAIPRPSIEQQQPQPRVRALSSPRLPHPPPAAQPRSPGAAAKTRIPVARVRTGSTSSHAARPNGYHTAGSTPDLSVLSERSRARTRTPDDAPPPRTPADDDAIARPPAKRHHTAERPSTADSEERPFEHWYRGEAARNGGVGEYRVGRRAEMLEIANYGHNPRAGGGGQWVNGSLRARRGSTGARQRESFYLDPGDAGGNVLDETLDLGDSGSEEPHANGYGAYTPEPLGHDDTSETATATWHSPPQPASRTPTPTQMTQRSATVDSSARARSRATATPSPTPLAGRSSSTPTTLANSRAASTPTKSSPAGAAKRRAKSPAAATPPSKKKAAPRASAGRSREDDEAKRRSVAQYPEFGSDAEADMSHAIPTWTVPAKAGNWDEVVLPAVARKKGLEGYVRTDGSPQMKEERDTVPEPAPGTFGYDYSKYKPGQMGGESIPMDEFGAHRQSRHDEDALADEVAADEPEDEERRPTTPTTPTPREKTLTRINTATRAAAQPPPSPAPFSRYAAQPEEMVMSTAQIPPPRAPQEQPKDEEDAKGGCCKCVIM